LTATSARKTAGLALFDYHSAMQSNNPTEKKFAGQTGAAASSSPTRVLRQFRVVFNAVKTHFRNVEKTAGIGGSQLWALSVVQQRPGISVGELARALDVHQTTASNLLKSLAAQGLIAMDRNGTDRRAVTVTLLPAGEVRLGSAPAPFAGVLPDALATLDAGTLARMEHDLNILITALEAGTAGTDIPLADL
jgi:DNA-binding MarR family transcriptional regulator